MPEKPDQQVIQTVRDIEERFGELNCFVQTLSQGNTQTVFTQETAIRFIREYFQKVIPFPECPSPHGDVASHFLEDLPNIYSEERLEAARFSGVVMAILDTLSLLYNIENMELIIYINPVSKVRELMKIGITDIYKTLVNDRSVHALRRFLDQTPPIDNSLTQDYYFMKSYFRTVATILNHISTLQGLETLPALHSVFPDN